MSCIYRPSIPCTKQVTVALISFDLVPWDRYAPWNTLTKSMNEFFDVVFKPDPKARASVVDQHGYEAHLMPLVTIPLGKI